MNSAPEPSLPFRCGDLVRERGTKRAGVVREILLDGSRFIVEIDDVTDVCSCADWRLDRDGCCVETAPLARVLEEFVDDWRRKRPPTSGRYNGGRETTDVEPIGPYAWLALDTGLREAEIRRVRNPERRPLTELRVADALVASIGEPGMFLDGTLNIRPNRRARPERRAECCGGSSAA